MLILSYNLRSVLLNCLSYLPPGSTSQAPMSAKRAGFAPSAQNSRDLEVLTISGAHPTSAGMREATNGLIGRRTVRLSPNTLVLLSGSKMYQFCSGCACLPNSDLARAARERLQSHVTHHLETDSRYHARLVPVFHSISSRGCLFLLSRVLQISSPFHQHPESSTSRPVSSVTCQHFCPSSQFAYFLI